VCECEKIALRNYERNRKLKPGAATLQLMQKEGGIEHWVNPPQKLAQGRNFIYALVPSNEPPEPPSTQPFEVEDKLCEQFTKSKQIVIGQPTKGNCRRMAEWMRTIIRLAVPSGIWEEHRNVDCSTEPGRNAITEVNCAQTLSAMLAVSSRVVNSVCLR